MTSSVDTNTVSASLLTAMNPSSTTSTSTAQADEDQFMTLLVAQMQNQDPTNPMDNSQVTSQMAQLSTVSGIDKLNTTLASLMSSYQASQTLQATSLIGQGVLVPGNSTTLSSGQAELGVNLASSVDNLTVKILDSSGSTVRTLNLGSQSAGTIPVGWDGTTDSGTTAADGNYQFQVSATLAGQSAAATALSYGVVGSVTTGSQGVQVTVPNVGTVDLSKIQQIF